MSDAADIGELSQRFACDHCGGRLRITTRGSTDASSWEWHQCVDCCRHGEFYITDGNERDGGQLRGVTERNHSAHP